MAESPSVNPQSQIRAYRGENLIKGLGSMLGSPEAAGRWYGFTEQKAQRYPFDKNPSFLGGAVTRTMDVSPEEIIRASHNAYTEHAKTSFNMNLEKGVARDVAENAYFKSLNDIDAFHEKALKDLMDGNLPQDRFDFMLKSTMAEGVFDKKGKIDPMLTIRRGNLGIGGLLAASKALPYIAKGAGVASLPLGVIAGATETGLDPEEEVAKAYGIDADVFYRMDPEQFNKYKKALDLQRAAYAREIQQEVETISPMVP